MDALTPQIIISLIGVAATAGATISAVRITLNGTKKRVEGLHAKLDKHIVESRANREETITRLTAVETILDERFSR